VKLSQMKPSKRVSVEVQRPAKTRLLVDLRELRESKGVTLRQVAEATGVSNPSLCQTEHGCTPSLETALRIAAFIELPVEKIWALRGKASK